MEYRLLEQHRFHRAYSSVVEQSTADRQVSSSNLDAPLKVVFFEANVTFCECGEFISHDAAAAAYGPEWDSEFRWVV